MKKFFLNTETDLLDAYTRIVVEHPVEEANEYPSPEEHQKALVTLIHEYCSGGNGEYFRRIEEMLLRRFYLDEDFNFFGQEIPRV